MKAFTEQLVNLTVKLDLRLSLKKIIDPAAALAVAAAGPARLLLPQEENCRRDCILTSELGVKEAC
ncbi:MAG: hypothetical protein ACLS5H_05320 [Streptococcus salivarius]